MNKQAVLDRYLQNIAEAEAEISQEIEPELARWRYEEDIIHRLLEKETDEELQEEWRIQAMVIRDMMTMTEGRLEELQRQLKVDRAMAQEIAEDINQSG